jgi:hypothetical protein
MGLAAGAATAAAVRMRGTRVVGDLRHAARGPRGLRALGAAALVAAGLLAWTARGELALVWSLPPLALALCVVALAPAERERALGRDGVRRGWRARSFAELEEWRLAGLHLRFRTGGRWEAIELPPEHHAAVAERLREVVPERESRYR